MSKYACTDHWDSLVRACLDTYGYAHIIQFTRARPVLCEFWGCRQRAYVEVS